jgi:hypothetical protein
VLNRTPLALNHLPPTPPPPINHHTKFPYHRRPMTSRSTTAACKSCVITRPSYFSPTHSSHVTSLFLADHSLSSTSSSRTSHPYFTHHLIPEISVGQSMRENISVSLLTCPSCPNRYPFVQIILFFTNSSLFTIHTSLKPSSSLIFPPTTAINSQKLQSCITLFWILQVSVELMMPKSKHSEIDENPFLPPPVDLDQIPLADKDYLISEPKCEFDFSELHSWFRDTFLD